MKRTAFTIFITLLLVLAIPVTLLCWGFLLPEQYSETFLGELKHKVQLLRDTPGRRIILVGGSSAAFGIDSALLEQYFPDYTVVNFGMYAALGTTVMLDLSEPYIREGDLVILLPEQQAQTLSDYFDASVLWQGVDGAFDLLALLDRDQLGQMAGQFPYFAARKFACVLRGQPIQPEGVYRRDAFNARGDLVSDACAQNILPGGADASTPILFDPSLVTEAFLERVDGYAAALSQQGATLYYAFCPMNAAAVADASGVDTFYDALAARLTFPILGDPHDSILEAGWFYDTNFHLNASGKIVYTRTLIRSLKAQLGDSSPTTISLPAMPELAAAVLWQGDDSHGDCFLLEARNGTAVITGLTEIGQSKPTLVIPSTWMGLPVTAVETLGHCPALRTLTIQQNIRSIADGAFSGCAAMKEIILESESPSQCAVGQGLLEGTDADLFVPPGTYSAYCTDYFWSVHALRIHEKTAP